MAQLIENTHEPMSDTDPNTDHSLRFEGTVALGGAITGQMLGILFGPESNVNGKLEVAGAVHIDGTFRGAIKTKDSLVVGEHARIEADINCGSALVHGTIVGNITATDSVALEGHAQVKGDITSPSLSVAKGAQFDGTSRMGTLPTASRPKNRR
jgi:cytoskeletal protein CcmA (bactofilin family)